MKERINRTKKEGDCNKNVRKGYKEGRGRWELEEEDKQLENGRWEKVDIRRERKRYEGKQSEV